MKNILVKVDTRTSKVDLTNTELGITGENLQGKIRFELSNFIDGQALLLVHQEYDEQEFDYFIEMEKVNNGYEIEIKNSLLKGWKVDLQLQITEPEVNGSIPVFKSNKFFLKVGEHIEASETIPDEYPTWLEEANAKIAELDKVKEQLLSDKENGVFNGKDGQDGKDGEKGEKGDKGDKGEDATINGQKTINIVAGTNINIEQEGETLTINSDPDFSNYYNKEEINNMIGGAEEALDVIIEGGE